MKRRTAARLLGAGFVLAPLSMAWARGKDDKPRRRIELEVSIERLGGSAITDATGMDAITQDLELARRGGPLKHRKGRRKVPPTELTLIRPAVGGPFRELFRAWVESPDKRTVVLSAREAGAPTADAPGKLLKRWKLHDCWPKSWKVSSGDVGHTEEMVVVIEWFEEA